ncbi:MAG: aldo/keto reductase [Endomicrobiales bacterium]|nr:aldo/keto reductase [Endomicrobiales bacterium]
MNRNRIGRTGLEFTEFGLGTWVFGGGGWKHSGGPQDDRESVAVIRKALELGINWIDTAPIYGLGHAEEVVGRALKGVTDRPCVATKFGLVWDAGRNMSFCLKRESVIREAEASLKRLKADVIDLYQIHWPNPEKDIEEGWEAALELVRQGKARHAGVSNFSSGQLEKILPAGLPASNQVEYNLINRGNEKEVFRCCEKNGIGILAYEPLKKGFLSGKYDGARISGLPADDYRKRSADFTGEKLAENLEMSSVLTEFARRTGRTCAQAAINFVLANPYVSSVIIGARNVVQLEENVSSAERRFRSEEKTLFRELLDLKGN